MTDQEMQKISRRIVNDCLDIVQEDGDIDEKIMRQWRKSETALLWSCCYALLGFGVPEHNITAIVSDVLQEGIMLARREEI